jgi:hypothetical protein
MVVYIRNAAIADAFKREFSEMFEFRKEPYYDSACRAKNGALTDINACRLVNGEGGAELPIGRFKKEKTPNTPRYFYFGDAQRPSAEVALHFAPTDDGEHRSILPMLWAVQPGDELRLSMFGINGIEVVRAIFYAAAKGANIQIVSDKTVGANITNGKNPLMQIWNTANPYCKLVDRGGAPCGTIEVRKNRYFTNHTKIGTLRRGGVDQWIIIGSQNWSIAGNDENDENMLTVRSREGQPLPVAAAFAEYFDRWIWPNAVSPDTKVQKDATEDSGEGEDSDG